MPRKCVFCDGTPVTLEHVWPDWVRRNLFKGKKPEKHTYSVNDEPQREWTAPPATVKAKVVCEGCNTGWMSDLETHAGPLLTRMARGNWAHLTPDDQVIVGRWAIKTSLMFQYVMKPDEGVNPAFCHGFYEHLEAAFPATYTWIASCDPRNANANFRSRNLWPAEVGIVGQAHGFVSAIRLYGVILLAYMHTYPTRTVTIRGQRLRSLIPPSGNIRWPLAKTFPVSEFNGLTEAFIGEPPTD